MTPDQIRQAAAEIAEDALQRAAGKGPLGWPTLDLSEPVHTADEEAIRVRLREIAEEVATRA